MALLPGIMSLFGRPSNNEQNTQPPPANPQTQMTQTAIAAQNPSVPSPATPQSNGNPVAIPPAATGDQSPLSNFADLFKADPTQTTTSPSISPNFNLDPQGILAQAQKVNFTQGIDPALVDKAMSGDKAAFVDVLNKVAQFGFANATMATGEIVKNSLNSAEGTLRQSVLPDAIRQHSIQTALNESNPVFTDPAVAPMLGMLKNQFATKYPTATPSEIAAMATQYLTGFSQKIVTAQGGTIVDRQQQQTSSQRGFGQQNDTDWSALLG